MNSYKGHGPILQRTHMHSHSTAFGWRMGWTGGWSRRIAFCASFGPLTTKWHVGLNHWQLLALKCCHQPSPISRQPPAPLNFFFHLIKIICTRNLAGRPRFWQRFFAFGARFKCVQCCGQLSISHVSGSMAKCSDAFRRH